MKSFRTISWYEREPVGEYVSHLLMELGRLGLEISDIEDSSRPPNTKTVLSDLIDWLGAQPSEAISKLCDWQRLDFAQLKSRLEKDYSAKPRIEISAHITKMNNLSVRWHPAGWRDTEFDWGRTNYSHFNFITQRKWLRPPDFHWFAGDEEPTFNSRPSNELMYIRGVGNLRPEPRDSHGPYAAYNADVVDSILICAVRAAYEGLTKQLALNFDVSIIDAFDFVIRDEIDESDPSPLRYYIHRVAGWSLEDAAELRQRRERQAAAAREQRDRAELVGMAATHGFTLETLVAALQRASAKKPTGPAPAPEHINRNAAKDLRQAGFSIDAGKVARLRDLIERYSPETLPDSLRPVPTPPAAPAPSNVVPLRNSNDRGPAS